MIRIGFDPILEAEQQHADLIREVERYRLAKTSEECTKPNTRNSFKLLALIGKGMVSLGANLEQRYGEKAGSSATLSQQSLSGDRS